MDNLSDWIEQSDTVRTVGKSKAVIVLQKTQIFQRAVFFTLLNPQPNAAGFAGVRTETNLNLTGYTDININCRAQGENSGYKIVLRHRGENNEPFPTYEQFFNVRLSIYLPSFSFYYFFFFQDPRYQFSFDRLIGKFYFRYRYLRKTLQRYLCLFLTSKLTTEVEKFQTQIL